MQWDGPDCTKTVTIYISYSMICASVPITVHRYGLTMMLFDNFFAIIAYCSHNCVEISLNITTIKWSYLLTRPRSNVNHHYDKSCGYTGITGAANLTLAEAFCCKSAKNDRTKRRTNEWTNRDWINRTRDYGRLCESRQRDSSIVADLSSGLSKIKINNCTKPSLWYKFYLVIILNTNTPHHRE